jgi:hypothetical protein
MAAALLLQPACRLRESWRRCLDPALLVEILNNEACLKGVERC